MESNENKEKCGSGRCGKRRWIKFPLMFLGFLLIKSAVVMLLWNALIPEIFHGPVLNYFQAAELVILARVLLGFGGHRGHWRHRHGMMKHHLAHLSPEERDKLASEIKKG